MIDESGLGRLRSDYRYTSQPDGFPAIGNLLRNPSHHGDAMSAMFPSRG